MGALYTGCDNNIPEGAESLYFFWVMISAAKSCCRKYFISGVMLASKKKLKATRWAGSQRILIIQAPRWEFPKIGDPSIVPQIVGSLL